MVNILRQYLRTIPLVPGGDTVAESYLHKLRKSMHPDNLRINTGR